MRTHTRLQFNGKSLHACFIKENPVKTSILENWYRLTFSVTCLSTQNCCTCTNSTCTDSNDSNVGACAIRTCAQLLKGYLFTHYYYYYYYYYYHFHKIWRSFLNRPSSLTLSVLTVAMMAATARYNDCVWDPFNKWLMSVQSKSSKKIWIVCFILKRTIRICQCCTWHGS